MIQMNTNLTRKLHTDFPVLYRGIDLSPQASAMCWGFECGDGWYSLIYELSEHLAAYQQQCLGLDLEITQVKSKLGRLCIHSRGGDTNTRKMIASACEQAGTVAEFPYH